MENKEILKTPEEQLTILKNRIKGYIEQLEKDPDYKNADALYILKFITKDINL